MGPVFNAVPHPDHAWKIVLGARGAKLELFDPKTPVPLPPGFDGNCTLWLRLKAQDAHILFTGGKLNYRRKRVVV